LVKGDPLTAEQYYQAVVSAVPDPNAVPLASGEGRSYHVDVLSVHARPDSTLVTFAMSLAGNGEASGDVVSLRGGGGNLKTISLVDPASGTTISPALFDPENPGGPLGPVAGLDCACSAIVYLDQVTVVTAWMGPLPTGTKTVTVRVPTVPDIENVPVTWNP